MLQQVGADGDVGGVDGGQGFGVGHAHRLGGHPREDAGVEALVALEPGRKAFLANQQDGGLGGLVNIADQLDHGLFGGGVVELIQDQQPSAAGQLGGYHVEHVGDGAPCLDAHFVQDFFEQGLARPGAADLDEVGAPFLADGAGGGGLAPSGGAVEHGQTRQAGGAAAESLGGGAHELEVVNVRGSEHDVRALFPSLRGFQGWPALARRPLLSGCCSASSRWNHARPGADSGQRRWKFRSNSVTASPACRAAPMRSQSA